MRWSKLLFFILFSTSLNSGCATRPSLDWTIDSGYLNEYVQFAELEQEFSGWISVHGEFQLFNKKKDFEKLMEGKCISGALPLREQRLLGTKVSTKKLRVIVTGKALNYSKYQGSLPPGFMITHGGSRIENFCGSALIIFARSVRVAN
jgi:hypothetical protein